MGRPKTGTLGNFHPAIVDQLRSWRKDKVHWGPKTLCVELKKCARFEGIDIPSRASIARFLKEEGYIKTKYKTRASKNDVDRIPKSVRPHQRLQIDAKGNVEVKGVGVIGFINIKDTYTNIYIGTFPAHMPSIQSSPSGSDYRLALRLSFTEHGLPEQIQTDHAGVFFDNQNVSPFPTLFHLWLIGLGLELVLSRVRKPTDQGQVERQHLTTWMQLKSEKGYTRWQHLYAYCEQRRQRLNFDIPCSTLGNKAPLEIFPNDYHSKRCYRPELENDLFDLLKVDKYLAGQSWERTVGKNGCVKIAKQSYSLKTKTKPGDKIKVKFNAFMRSFEFSNSDNLLLDHRPVKGLDKDRILGEAAIALPPGFQLQMPFESQTESRLRLYETTSVTS